MSIRYTDSSEMRLSEKLWQVNWSMIMLLCFIAAIGFTILYSAANGSLEPWAMQQMIRFAVGVVILLAAAVVDIRFWLRSAYAFYFLSLSLLVAMEIFGASGSGVQRWIDTGFFQFQPSEIMKVFLVLALARYFHGTDSKNVDKSIYLVAPLAMTAVPAILIMRQPDLGTATMLFVIGGVMFFLAGVRIWKVTLLALGALAAIPVGWQFLHDYQKKRLLAFLDPESDPLGTGYHIIQSKIALGSGGVFGKGFLLGSQSHLNFLPEKQTDFVFTMLAEEFGFVGAFSLIGLYMLLVVYGFSIALKSRSHFGRLAALGLTTTFFLYFFINIAMVMGVIPVAGVPLPLVSYGGTAMLTLMFSFGIITGVHVHRNQRISQYQTGQME
ncbi:MAG: rod shape-determining protein RodA [Rhodospirillaceae bacterium]|nr:rod shape-determining protein RodA [Rhodospirillaceae bacterium]